MKTKIFLFLSLFVISYSCYKEDPVKATVDNEKFVNFDSLKHQGTNMYQQRLFDYFDKYSVLTMYQFDSTLFQYEIVKRVNFRHEKADETYVGDLLDIIDELFYQQIGDKAIRKYLPLNVLLVSDLQKTDGQKEYVDCYLGLFCCTFSGADERIKSWNTERKQQFKDKVVYDFLFRMHSSGFIDYPTDFASISDYTNTLVTIDNYKEYGFVAFTADYNLSAEIDFRDYLAMVISTPTAKLNAEGGWFDPKVDTKGLIRKKYNSIVAFFKTYDVDLVKIADYQIK